MKRIITIFTILLITGFSQNLNAQAYDGEGDYKIFLGYLNVDGRSGVELQYDYGWNDILSAGGFIKYISLEEEFDNSTFEGLDKIDMGLFFRAHLSEPLKLDVKMDPYVGVDLSIKSLGAHAGFKYNFGEVLGVYAQVSPSFSTFLMGNAEDDVIENPSIYDGDGLNFYAKKVSFSGGITLYF